MQASQELRYRLQFNDEENQKISKNIKKITNKLKQELKQVEKNIRLYVNEELSEAENNLEFQIKDNISQNILSELKSFSKKFKYNQQFYLKKCKELLMENEEDNLFEMNEISTNSSDFNDNNKNEDRENFLMKDEPDQLLQKRDNELNEIVREMNNLQEMFKDLHVIVIEQGSILDRIDYNIDVGYTNVLKGKKKIISANEHHQSNCFRNVILFLLICIFVESLLILFKIL